jgi:cation diffusion facilitator CzcD-associated flavoprotein CzcO
VPNRLQVLAPTLLTWTPDFYQRYKIDQFTKLLHQVVEAVWDEDVCKWKLRIEDLRTGPPTTIADECDVLINGSGFLNTWNWPKIQGIESFKKPKLHSARWDRDLDLAGKTVALVGNGSSGIQVGPSASKPTILS